MIPLPSDLTENLDVSDPEQLRNFLIAVKQNLEELSRKASPIQADVRDTAPTELGEGEQMFYDDGVNRRIYTKIGGTIRYLTLT